MLWRWSVVPDSTLLVVVELTDGDAMNRRLRVLLSNARKGLKNSGSHYHQFGMKATVLPWANRIGERLEALQIDRVVNAKHRFIEHFEGMK